MNGQVSATMQDCKNHFSHFAHSSFLSFGSYEVVLVPFELWEYDLLLIFVLFCHSFSPKKQHKLTVKLSFSLKLLMQLLSAMKESLCALFVVLQVATSLLVK